MHENYGIGVFKGLEKASVLGSLRDFVVIEYQEEERVLLPVENLDMIDRFISDGSNVAIIDKLGKGSFTRVKEKAKKRLFAIAKELIVYCSTKRDDRWCCDRYQQRGAC